MATYLSSYDVIYSGNQRRTHGYSIKAILFNIGTMVPITLVAMILSTMVTTFVTICYYASDIIQYRNHGN